MLFATVVFFVALLGIIALFVLKKWENEGGRVFFSEVRSKADIQALRIKVLVIAGARDLEKLPPYLLHLARAGVLAGAIAFGHLAHWIGERSHDLADLVSHKHRFEKKELRSEFLKKVGEYPMRNRNGSNGRGSASDDSREKLDSQG